MGSLCIISRAIDFNTNKPFVSDAFTFIMLFIFLRASRYDTDSRSLTTATNAIAGSGSRIYGEISLNISARQEFGSKLTADSMPPLRRKFGPIYIFCDLKNITRVELTTGFEQRR